MNLVKLLSVLCLISVSSGAKILILLHLGTKSHFTVLEHLAANLGARGDEVTFISVHPLTKSYPNVEEIKLPLQKSMFEEESQRNVFSKKSTVSFFSSFIGYFGKGCENMFKNPDVKKLIDTIKAKGKLYDVAMVNGFMCECSLSLAAIAANHTMMVISIPIPQWIAYYSNIPFPVSVIPSVFSTYVPPMTFTERFSSTLTAAGFFLLYRYFLVPEMQETVDFYLPKGTPSIVDSLSHLSFILTNSDPVYTVPRPSLPFVADIGGIHLRKPKPLPKEFEDFINSAGDSGVVIFALGSFVQEQFMPQEVKDAFISAFSKLKQNVIWKFQAKIPNLPKNIKIVNWMPQQDILAHPKTLLFITHCGRLSLQESTYHGVPLIGIPLFGDQPHNIAIVKQLGIGEELSIHNITADWVYTLIQRILNDKRYYENSKAASSILRDRINSPMDTAAYWMDYVIRHNGAAHLKNKGVDELSIFQYFLLDIIACVVLLLGLGTTLFVASIVFLYRRCFKRKEQRKLKKK